MQSPIELENPVIVPAGKSISKIPISGKAGTLLELQRAGFNVPEFICPPDDLEETLTRLGFPIAVRSSASLEDGENTSFAGQFQSFLNLHCIEEVIEAIDKCHASMDKPSVLEYCRKNGIDHAAMRMNVIVQRMIEPELAGVAFTVNPTNGVDEVVIEACRGLSDDLLSGKANPLPHSHPLIQKYRPQIELVARRIQRYFGRPQDIEFAIADGELYVLQARPITQIGFATEVGEWTNADFRDGGVSCGVCTPLMWSLYDYIWEDALKGFLREIRLFNGDFQAGKMFFGRPYWNLGEVKKCLGRLPGFVERKFDEDLGIQPAYDDGGFRTPVNLTGILKALPTVFAIESLWKKQARFDHEFLRDGFVKLIQPFQTIPDDREPPLRELITQAYRTTETNYFRTIYCASLAKMDFKDSFPDVDCNALVTGLPRLQHLEPIHAMREMTADGDADITPLLARFGHHSRRELDISFPRWDEDHEWVEQLLRQSENNLPAKPTVPFEKIRDETLRQLPWLKRRSFLKKLERLRKFLWLREEMRDLSSRMYHLIRKYILEIARHRELGDDIFFMSLNEIIENDRSFIEYNRETHESYRNFRAPNEIGNRFRFQTRIASGGWKGIGASGGVVTGDAKVAQNIEEALTAKAGAILVCPFTDPGWTPVLGKVAGVVTETGGLLSHAAIICREYGIPAVLNLQDATRRIPDGSTIILDGIQGTVCIEKQISKNNSPNPQT